MPLEIIAFTPSFVGEGGGDIEVILRYEEVGLAQGQRAFCSQMDGSYLLTGIFNDFRSSELDTRIGNTGSAGVTQYNVADGQIAGDTIAGTDADDTLMGTLFEDVIDGGAVNHIIDALGGDDVVRGGDGNDEIRTYGEYIQRWGDYGNNLLDGGAGDDTATGGEGRGRFFTSGHHGDTLYITDYNRDEGVFLVVDGDLFSARNSRSAMKLPSPIQAPTPPTCASASWRKTISARSLPSATRPIWAKSCCACPRMHSQSRRSFSISVI